MGLFDRFKKQEEVDPSYARGKSLIDFAMAQKGWPYADDSAVQNPQYDDWESFQAAARPLPFAAGGTRRNIDDKWYESSIFSVPAEHVGGEEGETRYYGGGFSYPYRTDANTFARKQAMFKPFLNPQDSIPAARAQELVKEWSTDY